MDFNIPYEISISLSIYICIGLEHPLLPLQCYNISLKISNTQNGQLLAFADNLETP